MFPRWPISGASHRSGTYDAEVPTLLFVAAHPDDEAFGVARSVALHAADPGFRFVLVHATDGEAGEIAADSGVPRERLGEVRRQETVASWDAMGRQPDRHDWFGLPDGGLAGLAPGLLAGLIGEVLDQERPDVVATFGPDGISGHPDHIAVGAATTDAFLARAGDGGPGLQRLLHGAIPRSWVDRWNERRRARGEFEWDPSLPFHLRGVPDESLGVEVDTEALIERTVTAIRSHKTQWSYMTVDSDRALRESLGREHWVIAWPTRPAGSPLLSDIFDDLEATDRYRRARSEPEPPP